MSPAMKERLIFEASMLSGKQHTASLIIDEAAIQPKCVYDRKADTVFGLKDEPDIIAACSSQQTRLQIEYYGWFCMLLRIHTEYHVPTTSPNS
ncbi:hypothetical protein MTO96_039826 [Rhipicephalus appendiculatus]